MRYWISILAGICVILSSYQGHAQPPNDCAFAVPVCNSEELDYNSNGPGSDDFASGANSEGCLNGLEHQSAWFQIFIAPSSPPGATLAFTLNPNGGSGED